MRSVLNYRCQRYFENVDQLAGSNTLLTVLTQKSRGLVIQGQHQTGLISRDSFIYMIYSVTVHALFLLLFAINYTLFIAIVGSTQENSLDLK